VADWGRSIDGGLSGYSAAVVRRAGFSDGSGAVGGGEKAVFPRRNCLSVCFIGMALEGVESS
jgi:hypothetical protein